MEGREYDKIADMLAQIYNKYNNLRLKTHLAVDVVQPIKMELLQNLERLLVLNNFMGELEQKGLI